MDINFSFEDYLKYGKDAYDKAKKDIENRVKAAAEERMAKAKEEYEKLYKDLTAYSESLYKKEMEKVNKEINMSYSSIEETLKKNSEETIVNEPAAQEDTTNYIEVETESDEDYMAVSSLNEETALEDNKFSAVANNNAGALETAQMASELGILLTGDETYDEVKGIETSYVMSVLNRPEGFNQSHDNTPLFD